MVKPLHVIHPAALERVVITKASADDIQVTIRMPAVEFEVLFGKSERAIFRGVTAYFVREI